MISNDTLAKFNFPISDWKLDKTSFARFNIISAENKDGITNFYAVSNDIFFLRHSIKLTIADNGVLISWVRCLIWKD